MSYELSGTSMSPYATGIVDRFMPHSKGVVKITDIPDVGWQVPRESSSYDYKSDGYKKLTGYDPLKIIDKIASKKTQQNSAGRDAIKAEILRAMNLN